MAQVRVLSVTPIYRPKKKSPKLIPERHPSCQCQLVEAPVCIFCGESSGGKVFVEGAFIVKGGKNGKLVDRYRGVAHTSCVEKHRKDWYAKNKERALHG